jgi:type IV pilus assembly protein PilA
MKNKKGFTLIELLAVMVILAILAVITTPLVLGYIEDTKKETAMVSAKEYLKARKNEILQKV